MHALLQLALIAVLVPQFAQDSKPPPAKKGELSYPTFEPFTSSRMFKVMVGDPATLDFEAKADELAKVAGAMRAGKEAGEKYGGGKPDGPSALLEPRVADDVRVVMPLLPAAMMRLEPLWEAAAWSPEQLAAAQSVATFVAKLPDGPKLEFVAGKQAENKKRLRALVEWFRSQVAKPERYAAMIPTLDDGPFSGLPYENKGPLEPVQTQKIGDEIELRLCKVDRSKEPFVLQALRDKKVLWTRVVSGGPDESVRMVKLRSEPQDLGAYGWKVFLGVEWSQGAESAYAYLDAQGKLLFYFMSW